MVPALLRHGLPADGPGPPRRARPPLLKLLHGCRAYGGYVENEHGQIKGLYYAPFADYVRAEHGLHAAVHPHLAAAEIPGLLADWHLVIASVHKEIRRPDLPAPGQGGHLVLLTGHDHGLLHLHHARAGASGAVLAHTMADAILDVRINGASHGEIGINTLLAGSYGVPVVLASGDDAACEEFSALVPQAVTVPVKRGLGQHAADTLHPQEARERLRQGAGQALRLHANRPPVSVAQPLQVEVNLHQPRSADLAALIPGVVRSGRTVAFNAETMAAAYGMLQLLVLLTQIGP